MGHTFYNAWRLVSEVRLTHTHRCLEMSMSLFHFNHISFQASTPPGKWESPCPSFLGLLALSTSQFSALARVKHWRQSLPSEGHTWKPRTPLPQPALLLAILGHWHLGQDGHPGAQVASTPGPFASWMLDLQPLSSLSDSSHPGTASSISPMSSGFSGIQGVE